MIYSILILMSIILFYVLFLGRTIMLYRQKIKVWTIGTSTKNVLETVLENILPPFLLIWGVLIILSATNVHINNIVSNSMFSIDWIKATGIILCYSSLLIFLWALISFGKSWRIGIDEKNSNDLITTGAFRYSRNPIFLFMDMYFTGIMLVYPTIIIILLTICSIIGIHFQILREEKFLSKKFDSIYLDYKRQTRRYF